MLKGKLSGKVKKYVAVSLILAVLGTGSFYTYKKFYLNAYAQTTAKELTAKVAKGDLTVSISGTGTVKPVSRYDIVPLVKGNIISAPFEEGMEVKAGDVLYKIDDSDLSYTIEKSQNNVERLKLSNQSTQDSIKNLEVYAPFEGVISNFSIIEGDQVSANTKIADLTDDTSLKIYVPYDSAKEKNVVIGQRVNVTSDQNSSSIKGTVKYVGSIQKATDNGVSLCELEIAFDNAYAVTDGTILNIELLNSSNRSTGTLPGKASYSKKQSIVAQSSGTVKKVLVRNDEYVKAGQKLIVLENDTLSSSSIKNLLDIRDSQLTLDANKKQLSDYSIISPIDGKVIKKHYKTGDTITNSGNSSTILMTVGDMTKMVFDISVDELDIAKVEVGQKVSITADALAGTTFEGEVTSNSMEGTTSNGVTTYAVQVTVASPGKLKPGMNVNAKILVENKKSVLYVPIAAVTKSGNRTYVNVPGDSAAEQQDNAGNGVKSMDSRQRKEVTIGINTEKSIEIVSGLNEGDTVYLPMTSTSTTSKTTTGNIGGGGMMGGGRPPN